jgi:hypothetical protein
VASPRPVAVPAEDQPQEPLPATRPTWAHLFRAVLIVLGSAACIAVLIWAVFMAWPRGTEKVVEKPENRPEAQSDGEDLVRRHIVNLNEGRTVRFLRWGPHMSDREMGVLLHDAGLTPARASAGTDFFRVRYRLGPRKPAGREIMLGNNEEHDEDGLFTVLNGKLVLPCQSFQSQREGDDWKKDQRKMLAIISPSIGPER